MDENDFFRQATLTVCGNLAFEQALHSTLLYMRTYLPVDTLFVGFFDSDLGVARTIAKADMHGGTMLDMLTPIPAETRKKPKFMTAAILGQAVIWNQSDEDPMGKTMLRFYKYDETATSMMTMHLIGEGEEEEKSAGLLVVAHHKDAFTDEHARLVSMLAEPFKVALANTLKHREVLRLRDRLADDNRYLHRELQRISGDEIIGADFGLKAVMRMVR